MVGPTQTLSHKTTHTLEVWLNCLPRDSNSDHQAYLPKFTSLVPIEQAYLPKFTSLVPIELHVGQVLTEGVESYPEMALTLLKSGSEIGHRKQICIFTESLEFIESL
ncbi:hypothetical protein F511_16380 [Dorcoceras hygrometricum]|uniref:Uncharacterized protein n=1 Tax=Dorcoceras hygrometricum TaxID=472368 RepID=A0A2Z7AIT0_9LAMI|nr:hypothetical protein F511_16380 [Dorcoceras hygrometricum]